MGGGQPLCSGAHRAGGAPALCSLWELEQGLPSLHEFSAAQSPLSLENQLPNPLVLPELPVEDFQVPG